MGHLFSWSSLPFASHYRVSVKLSGPVPFFVSQYIDQIDYIVEGSKWFCHSLNMVFAEWFFVVFVLGLNVCLILSFFLSAFIFPGVCFE
jgi:hypothetical protein